MFCPHCKKESPEYAKLCENCGSSLESIPEVSMTEIKVSSSAKTAMILSIAGVLIIPVSFLLVLFTISDKASDQFQTTATVVPAMLLGILICLTGFILGIISKVKIKREELKGEGFANAAIIIGTIPISYGLLGALVVGIWYIVDRLKDMKQ